MENASDDDDCCYICLKPSNDGHLLSMVAKTADAITMNKLFSKLYNIEIVNAGSDGLQICISCVDTLEKAAKLKDCLQDREKFFKPTLEKVQEPKQDPSGLNTNETPPIQSPGCSKTTRSELLCVKSDSSVEQVKQRAEVEVAQNQPKYVDRRLKDPNKNDRLKRGRIDDEKPVQVSTKEKIEDKLEGSEKLSFGVDVTVPSVNSEVYEDDDIAMMPTEEGDTSSTDTVDLKSSAAKDRDEAKTFAENVDIEMLLPTSLLSKDGDHAPEIGPGKSDSLDDFLNNNVEEDSKSGGPSKEVAQARSQQIETVDKLTCHCGFKAVSVRGFHTHQRMKGCKRANLQIPNARSFEPVTSLPDLNSHAEKQLHRRSLPSDLKQQQKRKRSILLESDEEDELDSSIDVDDDASLDLDYVTNLSNSVEGCSTSRSSMITRRRNQGDSNTKCKSALEAISRVEISPQKIDKKFESDHCAKVHSDPRFTSVKDQQQRACISTGPPTFGFNSLTNDASTSSTEEKIERAGEPRTTITITSKAGNQYTESISFVKPKSSFSSISETLNLKRKSPRTFMCCKKDFATSENKLKHMETAHADRKQVCGDCGEVFYHAKNFRGHMEDHNNIRQFRCTFEGCIKSYDTANILSSHKRKKNHTDDRFKCCCGFNSINQFGLKKHQNKMKCSVGDTQEASSEKQAEGPPSTEQKIQSNAEQKVELPRFGCDQCGREFTEIFHLQNHLNAHLNKHTLGHPANPERAESLLSSTAPPNFECSCGYKTRDLAELKKHYEVGCPR